MKAVWGLRCQGGIWTRRKSGATGCNGAAGRDVRSLKVGCVGKGLNRLEVLATDAGRRDVGARG